MLFQWCMLTTEVNDADGAMVLEMLFSCGLQYVGFHSPVHGAGAV